VSNREQRVALVTGANRGLGLETSRQLLAKGLTVVLTGRDDAALAQVIRALPEHDQRHALALRMDVTDVDSMKAALRTVMDRFGGVHALINNAAILLSGNDDALSISGDTYRNTFETNVFGVIEACRVFVPGMASSGYGRVVNVSSGVGRIAKMSGYAPAYSMSKAALNAFTRLLAHSYKGTGVLVNAVDPGWVRTDMGGSSAPRSLEEGADTITWLATLPDDGATGGFFRDRRPIEW
jgi:NAD(P)-dependent dehydrogenase (short-subunit alcohol dehydrogenase family)